jgi:heme-degrading monooxygenase HmoA
MYVILWEFIVKSDKIDAFVTAYKSDGDWAQLFRRAAGYAGTELLSSPESAERFVTIDRWGSADDFNRFKERFGKEYENLDLRLEVLTRSETRLGAFTTKG